LACRRDRRQGARQQYTCDSCGLHDWGATPAELQLPVALNVVSVQRCTRSIFGIPYDWTLTVSDQKRPDVARMVTIGGPPPTVGPPTQGVTFHRTVPVDSTGGLTNVFYLDSLTVVLLAAYFLLCEWRFGATVGKRILDIRARALDRTPIDAATAGRRILVRMIPILPSMAFAMAIAPPSSLGQPMVHYLIGSMIVSGTGVVLIIVFFLNFIVTTSRRTLPWHDRWARTEAVRHAGAGAALSPVQMAPTAP